MNAAIGNQTLNGLPRHFATERIEAGEDDRARRVIDDQLDAGGQLQRPDVAAFAADDPALHVVAWQVDDRHRRLDRMLRRAALDRLRDHLARTPRGRLARFRLQPLHQRRRLAPRVGFDVAHQQFLGLVRRDPGQPLQVAALVRQRLLHLRDVLFPFAHLALGFNQQLVGLFLAFEAGGLADVLGVSFRLAAEAIGVLLRAADGFGGNALAAGDPVQQRACCGGQDDDVEKIVERHPHDRIRRNRRGAAQKGMQRIGAPSCRVGRLDEPASAGGAAV
jgi:hypothetical protein